MHTPGPWVIDDTTDDYEISIVGHPTWPCTRYGKKGEWDVCKLEKLEGSAAEERANARLIAVSPDLLTLAKQALQFAVLTLAFHGRDRGTDRQETMLDDLEKLARDLDDTAGAAIARATGASV